ncbi:MAG: Hpt domain-containing protein [Microcystaceae cyanobacterium]
MDTANQQKILGYFIEEAKEHLETLEGGILELSSVVEDTEKVNEMFRAAHSIKGGAAMLGYGSIQKTAHRLEDGFKILKENEIPIEQKLESLFLGVYDVLQDLIEHLQSPFGLRDEEAESILERGEPTFVELQDYLNHLLAHQTTPSYSQTDTATYPSMPSEVATQARKLLKQMLQGFKQQTTPSSRQHLQKLCVNLAQLAPYEKGWQTLTKMAEAAIANPKHSYSTLAPVVIQDLKRGSDLIEIGEGNQIVPSSGLQQLATAKLPQILVPLDPKSVANILRQMLNQQQVSQLVQLLEATEKFAKSN